MFIMAKINIKIGERGSFFVLEKEALFFCADDIVHKSHPFRRMYFLQSFHFFLTDLTLHRLRLRFLLNLHLPQCMDLLPQRSSQLNNSLLSFLLGADLFPTLDGNLTAEVLTIRIAVYLPT